MDVRNCKVCGKMFNYIGRPTCPTCDKVFEEKFQDVKKYVKEHPDANINTVARDNEVTVNQIKRWVREERLTFSDASLIGLECEKCGAMIKTGRMCANCKMKLSNTLAGLMNKEMPFPEKKHEKDNRMHFLDGRQL